MISNKNKYLVSWSKITDKNINNRVYSANCFRSAINKLGNKLIPFYASAPTIHSASSKLIGFANTPTFNADTQSLDMQITVFDPYIPMIKYGNVCFCGSGVSHYIGTSDKMSDYYEVDPESYEFSSIYLSRESAFPVTLSEIN